MPSFRQICLPPVVLPLLAACTESPSGPREEVDQLDSLIVTATVLETKVSPVPDQSPWIECRVRIDVRMAGSADGPVELQRIEHAFFTGSDSVHPADTIIATPNRLDIEFGDRTVYASALTSEWDLRANAPYRARGVVFFEDHTGDDGVAPFDFACGPVLGGDASPAGPSVTELTFSPMPTVELGTPVSITYEASAAMGLWETWIIVTHASGTDTVRLNEGLVHDTRRTVAYSHPSTSVLGDRMSVRVVTFDAALRQAEIEPALSPALSDTTPPWVGYRALLRGVSTNPCTAAACQLAPGDSVRGILNTFDESEGATLRLTYGPPLDRTDEIPIPDGWFSFDAPPVGVPGIYDVTGAVVDAFGNETTFPLGTINVYPVVEGATQQATFTGNASFFAADFARGRLYMAADSSESLRVVDLGGLGEQAGLALSGVPGGIDVAPDGVIAATIPQAHAVELRAPDGALLGTIPITALASTAGYLARDVVFTSAGTLLVALNRGTAFVDAAGVVIEIDTLDGSQTTVVDSASGAGAHYELMRSGDGTRVAINRAYSACVFDAASGTLTSCNSYVPPIVRGNDAGTRWVTDPFVYGADLAQLTWLQVNGSSLHAPHPSDDDVAFIVDAGSLLRYTISERVILESRPAVGTYGGELWISPDASFAVGAGPRDASRAETIVITVELQ
ncbi:MAG TPA: hypothetical protein VF039_15190 [Longimicrobiales bacterium]